MALDFIALGKRIRDLRKKQGLSQSQLSEILHVSATYISHLENGSKSMSLELFVSLVNALKTTADGLLCDSLDNKARYLSHSFSALLSDCNNDEQQLFLEILSVMKQAVRSYLRHLS